MTRLYYEAHITVEARDMDFWEEFEGLFRGFRVSRFDIDHVDDYNNKWFMSTRGKDLGELGDKIRDAINTLIEYNYKVTRWKIEDTLLDSKYGDTLECQI